MHFQPAGQKLLTCENVKLSLGHAKFGPKDFTPNSESLEPGVVAPGSPLPQLAYEGRLMQHCEQSTGYLSLTEHDGSIASVFEAFKPQPDVRSE